MKIAEKLSKKRRRKATGLRVHHYQESYDDLHELSIQEVKDIIRSICDEVDELMITLFKESPDIIDMSSDSRYQALMKEYKIYRELLIKRRNR